MIHLCVRPGIICDDPVTLNGKGEFQRHRLVHQSIGLQFTGIGAIRQGSDGGTHRRLTTRMDFRGQCGKIVKLRLLHQNMKALLHQIQGNNLSPKITHGLFRRAHILAQDCDKRLIRFTRTHELQGRDLQSFLKHFTRLWATDLAANIGRMRG